jgi:hypothetical protein
MPLTRTELTRIVIDEYFIACNQGDLQTVLANFAPDCLVEFSSADFQYSGLDAVKVHLEDFRETFATIDFHDFVPVVDTQNQTIAVRFELKLVDREGNTQVMQNCNFFHANAAGQFDHVMIYNSAPLDQGFQAGSQ